MKNISLILCLIFCSLLACHAEAQNRPFYPVIKRKKYTEADSLRGALTPLRTCFDVVYYDLSVKIIPKKRAITGHNTVHFKVISPTQRLQLDLYDNMKIDSVVWRGQKLAYYRKYHAFFVSFPETLPAGKVENLIVFYHGKPKEGVGNFARHGFHWTKDSKFRTWVGVSCEHDGASLWWPNKDHLSDEPDSMRIHITSPSDLVCISNGVLEKQEILPDGYTRHDWFTHYPINNYNVTFYLGHYIKTVYPYFNATGKHDLEVYVLDYERKHIMKHFELLPEMVRFLEALYGEYAFWKDKFAVVQSNYAGMEHQTCLAIGNSIDAFNNWYYSHETKWHSTLFHEIVHEWWGNAVSVKDMADVWLHEAFATYTEFAFMEYLGSKEAYKASLEMGKSLIQGTYPIVGNRDVNENTFADSDIYHRGARVIHELREELKDLRIFLEIHRTFQARFRYKTVTTQDYINAVNEVSKRDLTKFLMDRLYLK